MRRRRTPRLRLAALLALAGCVSDAEQTPEVELEPAPATSVSRTGVPVLMDLPVLGWLFRRETTVR